jgi:type IV secretory pathway VirB3-like protein
MRELVCVINQRACGRFSVVTYASAAFRYLVTAIVALVLALLMVLLIVEFGAAIGAALEHDMPASIIAEELLRAQARSERRFFGGQELRSDSSMTELTLDQQLCDPVRQRAQLSPPPTLSF